MIGDSRKRREGDHGYSKETDDDGTLRREGRKGKSEALGGRAGKKEKRSVELSKRVGSGFDVVVSFWGIHSAFAESKKIGWLLKRKSRGKLDFEP
jgi:hypothetical protein